MTNNTIDRRFPDDYQPPETIDELPDHMKMVWDQLSNETVKEGYYRYKCKPCGHEYLYYDDAEDCHPNGLEDSPRRCAKCGRIELVHKGGERNGSYRCYVCYSGTPESDAPPNPFPDYDGVAFDIVGDDEA